MSDVFDEISRLRCLLRGWIFAADYRPQRIVLVCGPCGGSGCAACKRTGYVDGIIPESARRWLKP